MFRSTRSGLVGSFPGVSLFVGAVALLVGGQLLYKAVLNEAKTRVRLDLNAAREIDPARSRSVSLAANVTTLGPGFQSAVRKRDPAQLSQRLRVIADCAGWDFAGIAAPDGTTICRISGQPDAPAGEPIRNPLVAATLALAYWNNRIAPVFDTARQIHVVEAESGQIVSETQETLPEEPPIQKTLRLVELGIGAMVCGAISRPMYELVVAYGIQVVPFVAGDLREVIRAWLSGNLESEIFAMPGCCGRRRPGGRREDYQEADIMNGRKRGMGAGRGTGQGQGGPRAGRRGGPLSAGPGGCCVCPQCGQREAHERGVPCFERRCPRCGNAMTRQ